MDGGRRVAEVLRAHGIPTIFTLCGGHISPILVGCKQLGIRIVDVRDEKNTVFAADAFARLTGLPGVAAVTAGPGVTNTITAVKNAQMAQSPLVLLGGATATVLRGRGSLQDIDQLALIKPHVKWTARPNTLRELAPAVERAFHEAQSGVPGPVFVEIAVDLLYDEKVVREWYSAKTDARPRRLLDHAIKNYLRLHLKNQFLRSDRVVFRSADPPDIATHKRDDVEKAAKILEAADRPVMLVGSQATLRPRRITELVGAVEALNIPVFLSGMARGLLGADHAQQMRHKRRDALREADVVLLAGVPCDFRLDYGGHIRGSTTLISVNRSKEDLKKNRKPDLGVLADPHAFLVDLARRAPGRARDAWLETLRKRNDARDAEIRDMAGEESTDGLNPLSVCLGIERQLSEDSILVVDGGDFVATASYVCAPRKPLSWLDPGVFGTLGVGAGFAMGAKLVRPDSDVWLLYGDGSAGFSISEFDTFVRHGLPVIAVVGNDAGWTQIQRDQIEILKDDVGTVLTHARYDKVAEGWGAAGILLDDPERIDEELARAVEIARSGTPVLVNVKLAKSDFRKGSLSM